MYKNSIPDKECEAPENDTDFDMGLSSNSKIFRKVKPDHSNPTFLESSKDESRTDRVLMSIYNFFYQFNLFNGRKKKPRIATAEKETLGPMWLRDLLPLHQLKARVLVFYHKSHWESNALHMDLEGWGDQLLQFLEQNRPESVRY